MQHCRRLLWVELLRVVEGCEGLQCYGRLLNVAADSCRLWKLVSRVVQGCYAVSGPVPRNFLLKIVEGC